MTRLPLAAIEHNSWPGDQPSPVREKPSERDGQGFRTRLRVWTGQGGGWNLEAGGQEGANDQRRGLNIALESSLLAASHIALCVVDWGWLECLVGPRGALDGVSRFALLRSLGALGGAAWNA